MGIVSYRIRILYCKLYAFITFSTELSIEYNVLMLYESDSEKTGGGTRRIE